jgi:hypothetical protein
MWLLIAMVSMSALARAAQGTIALEPPPSSVPRFEIAEFVVRVDQPSFQNPFTDVEFWGEFKLSKESGLRVNGFADSQDGSIFRLRFSPEQRGATYRYTLHFRAPGIDQSFKGELRCEPSARSGPAIVNQQRPKHFMFAGTGKPVYILGFTAYHLLDPTNDDAQVDATIDYCARLGFNRIRFLLTGYPRDSKGFMARRIDPNSPDPERRINYGEIPGRVNALPAWLGKPHAYDFSRFHIAYWQRVDRAVRRMRERGIFADCIYTIEKQDLPMEYGRLTDAELRLYRYGVARLAAFDNVWWDLGNEHNEYRDIAWGNAMGATVKALDPWHRLASVNAYEEFLYPASAWPDVIMTQQYGTEKQVNDWALKYLNVAKPYINEEYGYEGYADKPGHLQNADLVRRSHWAIAMAGGYATYGDWSNGVSYFYMGVPGPGVVAGELKHLREFFEALPFPEMVPKNELTDQGFCLARPPDVYAFYFPSGGTRKIDLSGAADRVAARWFDPRTGAYQPGPAVAGGTNTISAPKEGHAVLVVRQEGSIP